MAAGMPRLAPSSQVGLARRACPSLVRHTACADHATSSSRASVACSATAGTVPALATTAKLALHGHQSGPRKAVVAHGVVPVHERNGWWLKHPQPNLISANGIASIVRPQPHATCPSCNTGPPRSCDSFRVHAAGAAPAKVPLSRCHLCVPAAHARATGLPACSCSSTAGALF